MVSSGGGRAGPWPGQQDLLATAARTRKWTRYVVWNVRPEHRWMQGPRLWRNGSGGKVQPQAQSDRAITSTGRGAPPPPWLS